MTKKAAIYARVSTDDQADKGYSLPSQLDGCRHYIDPVSYTHLSCKEKVCGKLCGDSRGMYTENLRRLCGTAYPKF